MSDLPTFREPGIDIVSGAYRGFAVVDYPYGEKSATFLKRISKDVTAAAKDAGMLK